MTPDKNNGREDIALKLSVVVVLLWAAVIVASFVRQEYTGLAAVTPVMLIVCGYLFGYKGRNGNGSR